MIPVRPELFKFAEPQSVCRLSCTSKTLRIDVRGPRPGGCSREAQLQPPTPRDDDEALARVRREIAGSSATRDRSARALPPFGCTSVLEGLTLQQAIAREAPAQVAFTPNELDDFTFFLRLTDDAGELDLGR